MNTGIYAFTPEIFKYIPAASFTTSASRFFRRCAPPTPISIGFRLSGAYWADIGTPEEYVRATADALAGRVHSARRAVARHRGRRRTSATTFTSKATCASEPARVWALACGWSVRASIGDGVTVGDDARLERAIVWDAAAIGARARLTDAVVGIDYEVAADTLLQDTIVANEPVPS